MLAVLVAVGWDRLGYFPGSDDRRNTQNRSHLAADLDRYHNRPFTCVAVIDGDTIDVDVPDGPDAKTRIRLWGVDTPETGKGGREKMYFGEEATEYTRSLVGGQRVRVVLSPRQTRDKYGRLLAYVYLGETEAMLNEELIANGCGYADRRFDHEWKQRFITLEQRARRDGVGLWAKVTREQMPEWRRRYEEWRDKQPG